MEELFSGHPSNQRLCKVKHQEHISRLREQFLDRLDKPHNDPLLNGIDIIPPLPFWIPILNPSDKINRRTYSKHNQIKFELREWLPHLFGFILKRLEFFKFPLFDSLFDLL